MKAFSQAAFDGRELEWTPLKGRGAAKAVTAV
jgi:hypothetical protein